MHRELISDTLGTATITPSDPIRVNSRGSWEIEFQSLIKLEPNGSLRINIPHGFSIPQEKAFFDPGFITVETIPPIPFSISISSDIFCRLDPKSGHSGAWGRNIFIFFPSGLPTNSTIKLIYGNANYYGSESFSHAGAIARELSGCAEFTISVDPTGKREAPFSGYIRLAAQPFLSLLPEAMSQIKLIAPSQITLSSEGKRIPIHKITMDRFNNPISSEKEIVNFSQFEKIDEETRIFKEQQYTSNPIKINVDISNTQKNQITKMSQITQMAQIYWGDIHGHTIHSDGLGTIDEYYEYARNTAKLDFSAITDHDDIGPRLAQEEWELFQTKTKEWNEQANFVAILGHEYRNGKCDMNVYYPTDNATLHRGTDEDWNISANLTQAVRNEKGMIIPHMHFGADWSGVAADVYRVIEVYSQHGSAEYKDCPREIPFLQKQVQKSSESNMDSYIQSALNKGFRFGFTAGSDTHSGRPGLSDWTRVCRTYLGGLTAVFAPDLTRESIWGALYNRRCYATTGNRSILDFQLNEAPMGTEMSINSDEERKISSTIYADGKLVGWTIFKSGTLWKQGKCSGRKATITEIDPPAHTMDWYYIRFDLEMGEMVWSSPIWVDCDGN